MPVRRDKRTGAWIFQSTVKFADGKRKRIFGTPGVPGPYHDLARTRVGAIEAERRAISEAMTGKPLVAATAMEAPTSKTIREHSETFLKHYKPGSKPSAKRERASALKRILPVLGDLTPENLKQTDVDSFAADEFKRGMTPKTINNRLGVLSSLIKYAIGGKSSLRFKVAGMGAEIHAVDPADVERLLVACKDDRYRAAILLAAEAGLRAGEIRGLQWTDVKNGQLTIRRALDAQSNEVLSPKHGKVRTIPMSPRVTEVLAALPRRGIWIVSRLDGGALGYWAMLEAVCAIYDRSKVTRPPNAMHCLRHTFGTVMARRVPLPVLQKLMGHADVQTTMRYVDVNEDDKRDAIAAVFGRASDAQADSAAST
jgi:integrase